MTANDRALLLSLIAALGAWLAGGGASAQTFSYAQPVGVVRVPFHIDTSPTLGPPPLSPAPNPGPGWIPSEFVLDPFGGQGPSAAADTPAVPWALQRLASNLRRQYRLIGNPYLRGAGITFPNFAMNNTVTSSPLMTSADFVTLGWFAATAPAVLGGNPAAANGAWGRTVTTTVYPYDPFSLMYPGMLFRVITGPSISDSSTRLIPDAESWGFETSSINVIGGELGTDVPPTLSPYDSVIAVLMPTDDTVRTLIAQTGEAVSVMLWTPPPATYFTPGITLWARCGAPPTATEFDRRVETVAPGRAMFQMDVCPNQQSLHVAVTNTSSVPRAVRMYVGTHRANEELNLTVGVQFRATPAEMALIRQIYTRAAWMFFGVTGGSRVVRSYRFMNGPMLCNTSAAVACGGERCDVCVHGRTGRASCMGETLVNAYLSSREDTITHEFGHCFLRSPGVADGLPDEYRDRVSDCRPPGGSVTECGSSVMGTWNNNEMLYCTPETHIQIGTNWTLGRSQFQRNVSCGNTWIRRNRTDNWTWIRDRIAQPYPSYQTPEVLRFERFWGSQLIGRIDRPE